MRPEVEQMEALVEIATLVTGVALGVAAARALLSGILTVTFGRGAGQPAITAPTRRA
jgi:hypothetical protein